MPNFAFYDLDVASMFTNNASAYCPLEKFKLSKVYNSSSGAVYSVGEWGQRMRLNEFTGFWELFSVDISF